MKHIMTCGNTLLVGSKALDSYVGSKENVEVLSHYCVGLLAFK